MADRPLNRNTLVMPISPDRNQALPHTPTQRDVAALVAGSVRPTLQRERGCAYRPLLDGSLVARFAEAAVFESLLQVCREVPALDILDLSFDDGAMWERFLFFLSTHNVAPDINLIALRDTTPDVRDSSLRMRAAAAAAGLGFDSSFMVTAAQEWPGAIMRKHDTLVIVANMALHHVPDDGPAVDSTRTMVLRRLRRLEPRLLIAYEADFGPDAFRVLSRLGTHGSSANEVMDALAEMHQLGGGPKPNLPQPTSGDEPPALPAMWPARPELPDRLENWRRRFFDAGYSSVDLMPLRGMIVRNCAMLSQAVISPDQQALRLAWRGKPISNASAWRPRAAR